MLFYMLKDGYKLMPSILKFVPRKRTAQVEAMLQDMSNTLSKYISGQAIECIFVGICTAIGYGLAGVPYALLTGIFAGATNIVGSWKSCWGTRYYFMYTILCNHQGNC